MTPESECLLVISVRTIFLVSTFLLLCEVLKQIPHDLVDHNFLALTADLFHRLVRVLVKSSVKLGANLNLLLGTLMVNL